VTCNPGGKNTGIEPHPGKSEIGCDSLGCGVTNMYASSYLIRSHARRLPGRRPSSAVHHYGGEKEGSFPHVYRTSAWALRSRGRWFASEREGEREREREREKFIDNQIDD